MTQNIIIVIPGTTGSTLFDPAGNEVWTTEVFKNLQEAASLLEQTDLTVGSISAAYTPLITALATKSGTSIPPIYVTSNSTYDPNPFPTTTEDVVVGFGYDWRQNNNTSAQSLATLLSVLFSTYSANTPKFWIVAHSMGGLISRYVWESGLAASQNFAGITPNLITLGTPHLGAPLALAAITDEIPSLILALIGIPGTQIQEFVDDTAYPSTFELLPPPGYNFITDVNKTSITYSVFDPTIISALESGYGVGAADFTAPEGFFSKLSQNPTIWTNNLYLIWGNDLDTTIAYNYDGTQPVGQQLSRPGTINLKGDMVVPYWSASFSTWTHGEAGNTYVAAFVDHINLPKNPGVQNQVTSWIYP
ncbi:lipase family alpha/beta hydrolase [Methylobacter tundripaludum]|uniref:Lecithin:cholesterol acyltransferase n=1 Tax=Methylobacter tundripaludum (strain ATCC BAA-1195 / DSM 17260 / SV96) TaxID=697282 RepID=G3IXA8_METTV|nr:hypothetical protein [Methylobacter tundripaludum]EGW23165.1 hypothetical protein Mettu_2007 [Methylobacter tundripaludum SV96]